MPRAPESAPSPDANEHPDRGALEPSAPVRSDERRRLLRGGLAAGPIIMSVMSRPVFGSSIPGCASVHIQASFQANPNTSLNPQCRGDPPPPAYTSTQWSANGTSWPSPYVKSGHNATLFESPTTGLTTMVFPGLTMLQVLQGAGGTYGSLGADVAAALLNAAKGKTPYLSKTTIQQMWNSVAGSLGYYQVDPGIRWYSTQVANYLQSTWGA